MGKQQQQQQIYHRYTWRFINQLGKEEASLIRLLGYVYIVRVCVNMTRFSTRFSSCGGKEWGNWGKDMMRKCAHPRRHCRRVPHKSYSVGDPTRVTQGQFFIDTSWVRDTIMTTIQLSTTYAPEGRGGGVFLDTKLKSGDDEDGVYCSGHSLIHCTWMEMGNLFHHRHLVACVKHASP
jgi:hypothetical protein